ncbi:hypothetical protein [Amycolatopsis sp. NPDC051061]|uniref:hypothetical protein n=1 Tax=Amycolatopsis sp. NPDC051061 TaxID=3155042 RepID=UPI00341E271D
MVVRVQDRSIGDRGEACSAKNLVVVTKWVSATGAASASGAAGLVVVVRSAVAGGDDGAEVFFGEAQVLADERAGDEALAGFASEPGLADGQSLGCGCRRVEELACVAGGGVVGLGLPKWVIGWQGGLEVRDG